MEGKKKMELFYKVINFDCHTHKQHIVQAKVKQKKKNSNNKQKEIIYNNNILILGYRLENYHAHIFL